MTLRQSLFKTTYPSRFEYAPSNADIAPPPMSRDIEEPKALSDSRIMKLQAAAVPVGRVLSDPTILPHLEV